MSHISDKLINANLVPLTPYESARRLYAGGQDWLNANESPYSNAFDIDAAHFNRYPSCQPASVIEGYARYAGLANNQVMVSRGADEGIELLIRTFCTPGTDNILICPPTYGMYAISAETCNVGVKKVPLNDDFSLNTDAICATGDIKLVFLCAPNNPTGTAVDKNDVVRILDAMADRALVIMDEAYIEFDPDSSWAAEIGRYPNLVILRTLSKAFALAGLRCGFTLAQPEVISALLKVIAPYPIPDPVAQIATQALSDDGLERLSTQVAAINQRKTSLTTALSALPGVEIVGDQRANFVLFRYAQAPALMTFLVENGMLIRDQSKQLNLSNCLRVSIGTDEQHERLLSLITTFINERAA
ncbi:histidinol-phosphate transaminase [Alteromonas sp. CYL-A6]|uniref:histidinol-phosphate transaminase n=1 Tax=Alteromonas nitratireducens TaxID=3390813 RepID=UPI0034AEB2C8